MNSLSAEPETLTHVCLPGFLTLEPFERIRGLDCGEERVSMCNLTFPHDSPSHRSDEFDLRSDETPIGMNQGSQERRIKEPLRL